MVYSFYSSARLCLSILHARIQGEEGGGLGPSEKSQVAIGLLKNSGTDQPQEAFGPHSMSLVASRRGFIGPSMKYASD